MTKINEMNNAELAGFVCNHLYLRGMKCVLSGGACVSVYSGNQYQSYDIDFIDNNFLPRHKITTLLAEIGFIEENRYYRHPDTNIVIEFPTGPLSVGSEPVKDINELVLTTGRLFLLSPTDCVKDRLCAFYYWDDLQSLEQAKMVTMNQNVDLNEVRRWSISEGKEKEFGIYFDSLASTK